MRGALLVRAWLIALFLAFAVALHFSGVLTYQGAPVAIVLTALILANLILMTLSVNWANRFWLVWSYEGFHAAAFSVVLHYFGGLEIGLTLLVYGTPILHTKVLQPRASSFVTANLAALAYATMALFEGMGWVPTEHIIDVSLTPGQKAAFVAFAFLGLNVIAVHVERSSRQLRAFGDRLQLLVAERTRELEAANTELAAKATALATKQEDLRTFVYAVTHDLKGPLNTIHLMADIALERANDALSADTRTELARIAHLAGVTEEMIQDLLGMFQILSAPEDWCEVDLNALVQKSLDKLQAEVSVKRVRVSLEPLPQVWGQPVKLGRVIDNLIANAVKYIRPSGGSISVAGTASDESALLCVSDDGIGIPAAYHRSIFGLFRRVPADEYPDSDVPQEGTGVGLAVVQQIVEAHGGRVWVESEVGAGSRFYVWLPSQEAKLKEASRQPAAGGESVALEG